MYSARQSGVFPDPPGVGSSLQAYAGPAAMRAETWRTLSGLGMILALHVTLGLVFILGAVAALAWLDGADQRSGLLDPERFSRLGSTADGLLLLLASFGTVLAALWITLHGLHRRRLRSLFGPDGTVDLAGFLTGLILASGFSLLSIGAGMAILGTPVAGTGLADWGRRLPLALALLLMQCAAEELVFRGYLLQQLRARWESPLVWAVLPSLLFGVIHYSPDSLGSMAGLAVVAATASGLVFALATAQTGNPSMAIGLHFGINIGAVLVIGHPEHLGALALWEWPGGADLSLPALADIGLLGLMGMSCYLFAPVRPPIFRGG